MIGWGNIIILSFFGIALTSIQRLLLLISTVWSIAAKELTSQTLTKALVSITLVSRAVCVVTELVSVMHKPGFIRPLIPNKKYSQSGSDELSGAILFGVTSGSYGPQRGCAWVMSTVCVIIMLSPQAPTGALPQRQHSPWWASTRTITGKQPPTTAELLFPDVLMLRICLSFNLGWFFSNLIFSNPLFWRLSLFIAPFQNAENVNDMQQLEFRLHKLEH